MRKITEMNDRMKAKYAELFLAALDSMEQSGYEKSWITPHNGMPCNLYRKNQPYQGVNLFLLSLLIEVNGFNTPYFVTFDEMTNPDRKFSGIQLKATMKLDENGMPIISKTGMPVMLRPTAFPVWKYLPRFKDKDGNKLTTYEYEQLTEEEKEECKKYYSLRVYNVWNIDQTNFKEIFPEDYKAMTEVKGHEYKQTTIDPVLERMIMQGEWRCPIMFGGYSAHFSVTKDHIRLPERSHFISDTEFYSTAIHEMAHSTRQILKRDTLEMSTAFEELVAELTAACVCSMLGVGKLLDQQHLGYVDEWRQRLRSKDDFLPQVIDHVQRASNYILGCYKEVAKKMDMPKMIGVA